MYQYELARLGGAEGRMRGCAGVRDLPKMRKRRPKEAVASETAQKTHMCVDGIGEAGRRVGSPVNRMVLVYHIVSI